MEDQRKMNEKSFTVKSKGVVLGDVVVPQYDSVKEAVAEITPEKALAIINKTLSEDACNKFRAEKTRTTDPYRKLTQAAKEDPAVKAKLDEILKEMGIEIPA